MSGHWNSLLRRGLWGAAPCKQAQVAHELEIDKARHIEDMGGKLVHVDLDLRSREAERLGSDSGSFFLNQFGNADRSEEAHESSFRLPFCPFPSPFGYERTKMRRFPRRCGRRRIMSMVSTVAARETQPPRGMAL